jgi:3-oxoacyl-[acyl-carrier protein] reductase
MSCKGKVALVTGSAGNGIGRSIALALGREGAKVVINYRSSEKMAAQIEEQIKANQGEAISISADIMDKEQCEKMVQEVLLAFGTIDICIIGPGAGWNPESPDKLNSDNAIMDYCKEINPIYNLFPLILPIMYKHSYGRIIGLAMNPDFLSPSYSYNTAKLGRIHSLELAYKEAWKHNVTINSIAPGPVNAFDSFDQAYGHLSNEIMEKRNNVTPQDIAEIVAFLCSDYGRYVTGNTIKLGF